MVEPHPLCLSWDNRPDLPVPGFPKYYFEIEWKLLEAADFAASLHR
jgi:hypothetical protein